MLLGLLCASQVNAQALEWTLLEKQSGVKIYRAYSPCEGKPFVLIKVENLNNRKVTVNWKSKFKIMGTDVLTEDARTVTVQPKSILIGDCQNSAAKIDPSKLVSVFKPGNSDYVISNLSIN